MWASNCEHTGPCSFLAAFKLRFQAALSSCRGVGDVCRRRRRRKNGASGTSTRGRGEAGVKNVPAVSHGPHGFEEKARRLHGRVLKGFGGGGLESSSLGFNDVECFARAEISVQALKE